MAALMFCLWEQLLYCTKVHLHAAMCLCRECFVCMMRQHQLLTCAGTKRKTSGALTVQWRSSTTCCWTHPLGQQHFTYRWLSNFSMTKDWQERLCNMETSMFERGSMCYVCALYTATSQLSWCWAPCKAAFWNALCAQLADAGLCHSLISPDAAHVKCQASFGHEQERQYIGCMAWVTMWCHRWWGQGTLWLNVMTKNFSTMACYK